MPLPQVIASDATTGPSLPAGNHASRLVGLVGLGMHKSPFAEGDGGAEPRLTNRVLLVFEVPAENAVIGHVLTLSLHLRSGLRPVAEALLGRPLADKEGLDPGELLGKGCLVDVRPAVSATGRTFSKVAAVTSLPKGLPAPEATRALFNWYPGDPLSELEAAAWLPHVFGRPALEVVRGSVGFAAAYPKAAIGAPTDLAHAEADQAPSPISPAT